MAEFAEFRRKNKKPCRFIAFHLPFTGIFAKSCTRFGSFRGNTSAGNRRKSMYYGKFLWR
jgi:hypothetical protein